MTPPWRGFIDGKPVALDPLEVRDRWPGVYRTHWQVDRPGVQIASSAERARELHWPKVVKLFFAARREDAPLVAMVRDAEAKRRREAEAKRRRDACDELSGEPVMRVGR